jgi:hypothetical protein
LPFNNLHISGVSATILSVSLVYFELVRINKTISAMPPFDFLDGPGKKVWVYVEKDN